MNIFKEMLNDLPEPKNKIIADDPKDQYIAEQFSGLTNWKIIQSRSDKHPECGYPMGQILCRNVEEAKDYIEKSEFKDLYISDYK